MAETAQSAPEPAVPVRSNPIRRTYTLMILTAIYMCNQLDRSIIGVVLQPIKAEFSLTDSELGLLLGLSFTLLYSLTGVPMGILADRLNRRNIVSGCLLLWSGMTVLCGYAQSNLQLIAARMGVGAGEGGAAPAAMSMISDLFPLRQRARALGVYYLASPLGLMLAFVVGSQIAASWGWRWAFILAGLPGLLLAALLLLTVREPVRGAADRQQAESEPAPPIRETLHFLAGQSSLLHICGGLVLLSFILAGELIWMVAFLNRVHGMSLVEAGSTVGIYFGAVSAVGIVFGGVLADWLGQRDARWRTYMLAGMCLVAGPALLATLFAPTLGYVTIGLTSWALTTSWWYGPGYGLTQSLVRPRMRATLASLLYLATNLIGAGLGPQVVGWLSDHFTTIDPAGSMRIALAIVALLYFWAAAHFLLASVSLHRDFERVKG